MTTEPMIGRKIVGVRREPHAGVKGDPALDAVTIELDDGREVRIYSVYWGPGGEACIYMDPPKSTVR